MNNEDLNAEVISVYPDKVKISVRDLKNFKIAEQELKIGSYLQISDHNDIILIAIIESFSIELVESKKNDPEQSTDSTSRYIIVASPLGIIEDGKFTRGGDTLSIPPKKVEPAKLKYIKQVFEESIEEKERFCFCKLVNHKEIEVPVNGNNFFNKHIAIVGASGSGKSNTTAKIIQNACTIKNDDVKKWNNSHIIIFDIHNEFGTAFPEANKLNVDNLKLPYWLLNGDELEELFLESGENNNYNQAAILRKVITENKKFSNSDKATEKIYFDSPLKFSISEVVKCLHNLIMETTNTEDDLDVKIKGSNKLFTSDSDKIHHFFTEYLEFDSTQRANSKEKKEGISKGGYNDGKLDKFEFRFKEKVQNNRLQFLFNDELKDVRFEDVIKQLIGYDQQSKSNVTLIDLSGIPFEVLSITVSLISRILFEYGYYMKRKYGYIQTPLLLVYEEAHKYAPKSNLVKFRSSTTSIERIAKEGRKYGVALAIVSQRPSEVSETIFSQCSSFIAMRLTNPDDQNYVKKLLPDTLGNLTEILPSLQRGEGLLIGESVIMPCIVKIDECTHKPSSNDIKYLEEWKKEWYGVNFSELIDEWVK